MNILVCPTQKPFHYDKPSFTYGIRAQQTTKGGAAVGNHAFRISALFTDINPNDSENCKISPLLFQKSSDFVHGDAEVEVVSTPQLRKVDGN